MKQNPENELNTQKTRFYIINVCLKYQGCIFADASCYESEVRFPSDQKLLWELVHWSFHQMKISIKLHKSDLM